MFEYIDILIFNIWQISEWFFQILKIYLFISFSLRDNQNFRIRIATTNILVGEPFTQSFKFISICHNSFIFVAKLWQEYAT